MTAYQEGSKIFLWEPVNPSPPMKSFEMSQLNWTTIGHRDSGKEGMSEARTLIILDLQTKPSSLVLKHPQLNQLGTPMPWRLTLPKPVSTAEKWGILSGTVAVHPKAPRGNKLKPPDRKTNRQLAQE